MIMKSKVLIIIISQVYLRYKNCVMKYLYIPPVVSFYFSKTKEKFAYDYDFNE